jgi:hypothetical protein
MVALSVNNVESDHIDDLIMDEAEPTNAHGGHAYLCRKVRADQANEI